MSNLFWPADHLAGELFSDAAWFDALVAVEEAWLATLADLGVAPRAASLVGLVTGEDREQIAVGAATSGNPVIDLVALLRDRLDEPAATWLHRGLTSQDVVDTALVWCARDVTTHVRSELDGQLGVLDVLLQDHARTPLVGRTLTQHAVPITFGTKLLAWAAGTLDAADALDRLEFPVAAGGAAGTLSAVVELAGAGGATDAVTGLATRLGLTPADPWHTSRGWVTRTGDALVTCTDAWGRIATDVATLSRPEIGELAEGTGGGSSTMPHKHNPVRSVLLRRTSLAAPPLASTLHLAAATAGDERPDGPWHAEWDTLRLLARRSASAAVLATDLLTGLRVDTRRMAENLASAQGVASEQAAMAELAGHAPSFDHTGMTADIVRRTRERIAATRARTKS